LIKKGMTLEAQEKIMELREAALQCQEENLNLRKRIQELENQLTIRENLIFERPVYYLKSEGKKDGPFCQVCYDRDGKLIRLQDYAPREWNCIACRSFYREGD
jgi:hypothetical protein